MPILESSGVRRPSAGNRGVVYRLAESAAFSPGTRSHIIPLEMTPRRPTWSALRERAILLACLAACDPVAFEEDMGRSLRSPESRPQALLIRGVLDLARPVSAGRRLPQLARSADLPHERCLALKLRTPERP
ncbi:hypothetical protein JHW43_001563 [Diplocarpon mali]|nr:hypothetical protein JHW43_001563 [Diplocarpon mali]